MKKLFIKGNYIIADNDGVVTEYSSTQCVYAFRDDAYRIKEELDKGQLIILVADIGDWFDEAGVVAFTETTLKEFLRGNTGISIGTSSESITSTVTVDDIAAVVILAANPDRIGYSVYNTGSQDVVIRYYPAAQDDDIEGYNLEGGDSKEFHNVNYKEEISSIRSTTTGGLTSDIKIMEW